MREFLKSNKILLIILAVCVIAAAFVICQRAAAERANKTYDVVLDYNELVKLAEQSDQGIDEWLQGFKDMGITKVGLQEESIITLMEDTPLDVTGEVMENVMKRAGWRDEYPVNFINSIEANGYDRFDVLVEAKGQAAADFVSEGIISRIDPEKYISYMEPALTDGEGNQASEMAAYFLIDGTSDMTLYSDTYKYMNSKKGGFTERSDIESSKIMFISLGLLPEKVETVKAAGMEIVPRTLAYSGWNGIKYAEAVTNDYEKYGIEPAYIIAGGEAVIGYDDGIDFAKEYILGKDIPIGLIENTTQLQNIMQYGVDAVTIASEFNTVRVFTVWDYIQYRYQYYGYPGAEEIENTLFRAVTERNVRVLYFKPFKELKDQHTYITDMDEYADMFDSLEQRLERHGFSFGEAEAMNYLAPNTAVRIAVAIGACIGAVLLLCAVLPVNRKWSYILSGLAVLGVLAAYFIMPNTSVILTSLGACIVFGCLAVTFVTAQARYLAEDGETLGIGKIIAYASLTLLVAVIIALIGGIMTAAPLSATSYMLEIDIFRGVKIGQLLPIAFFAVAYLAYYGFGARKRHIGQLELHDLKDMMNLQISVWMVLALGVVAVVGYYYIARTGHDSSIEVSSVEMLFRNKLEELLLARPRTKEFLFAFPAIMMMVYCSVKHLRIWTIIFGLAGSIGVVSVINTFEHIRTPLYLGFARTGYSLLFGLILGVIAIVIFDCLYRVYKKYFKEKVDRALDV